MTSTLSEQSKGRIIVVGAGYGGLATAIELTRKGFEVEVFEAVKQLTTQGLEYPHSVEWIAQTTSYNV